MNPPQRSTLPFSFQRRRSTPRQGLPKWIGGIGLCAVLGLSIPGLAVGATAEVWTPADIPMALWLDAADASTITLVGSKVAGWKDKSGNKRHATQGTANLQPTYTPSGLNALNVVTTARSNTYLDGTLTSSDFTIGIVARRTLRGATIYYPLGLGADSGVFWGGTYGPTTSAAGIFAGKNDSTVLAAKTAVTDNTAGLLIVNATAAGRTVWFNGGGMAADTLKQAINGYRVGNRTDGAWPFPGDIAEIVITAGSLSADNRLRLEGYLAHKWGLATQLPAGHPYKTDPPQAVPAEWRVRVWVEKPADGFRADALLGKRADAAVGYDSADLMTIPPAFTPYMTLVFPHADWAVPRSGDYATEFRPADGARDAWNLELRDSTGSGQVVLRWEGDSAVLDRSRLIDVQTGAEIDPRDPTYAGKGYPLTLSTAVRRLTWEYLGD